MQDQSKKEATVVAQVVEALPNTFFKVIREDNGEELLTYLSGKMRLHRIKVLIGDKVVVEIDPYGGKGRVVKRV
ncbi:MAG TPA: translation initiation factor IF-1 [Candidatus Paceibacterota bacterium]